jgi:hypothetical protein
MADGFKLDNRFRGRPDTLPIIDAFWDWLEAAYWRAVIKDKKLTKVEFLRQLPAYLDHKALRLWRHKNDEILRPPEDKEVAAKWDPIEEVVKLFKKEFGLSSPDKVRELQGLTRRPGEKCRMLRRRLERLCEETGLLTEREKAVKYAKALEPELRAQVRPVLYASSEGGHYTLEQADSIAEKIDLASAYADGFEEVRHGVTVESEDRRVIEDARGFGKRRGALSAAADARVGRCSPPGARLPSEQAGGLWGVPQNGARQGGVLGAQSLAEAGLGGKKVRGSQRDGA